MSFINDKDLNNKLGLSSNLSESQNEGNSLFDNHDFANESQKEHRSDHTSFDSTADKLTNLDQSEIKEPRLEKREFKSSKVRGQDLIKSLDNINAGIINYLNLVNQNTTQIFQYVKSVNDQNEKNFDIINKNITKVQSHVINIENTLTKRLQRLEQQKSNKDGKNNSIKQKFEKKERQARPKKNKGKGGSATIVAIEGGIAGAAAAEGTGIIGGGITALLGWPAAIVAGVGAGIYYRQNIVDGLKYIYDEDKERLGQLGSGIESGVNSLRSGIESKVDSFGSFMAGTGRNFYEEKKNQLESGVEGWWQSHQFKSIAERKKAAQSRPNRGASGKPLHVPRGKPFSFKADPKMLLGITSAFADGNDDPLQPLGAPDNDATQLPEVDVEANSKESVFKETTEKLELKRSDIIMEASSDINITAFKELYQKAKVITLEADEIIFKAPSISFSSPPIIKGESSGGSGGTSSDLPHWNASNIQRTVNDGLPIPRGSRSFSGSTGASGKPLNVSPQGVVNTPQFVDVPDIHHRQDVTRKYSWGKGASTPEDIFGYQSQWFGPRVLNKGQTSQTTPPSVSIGGNLAQTFGTDGLVDSDQKRQMVQMFLGQRMGELPADVQATIQGKENYSLKDIIPKVWPHLKEEDRKNLSDAGINYNEGKTSQPQRSKSKFPKVIDRIQTNKKTPYTGNDKFGSLQNQPPHSYSQRKGEPGEFNVGHLNPEAQGQVPAQVKLESGKSFKTNSAYANQAKDFVDDLESRGYKINDVQSFAQRQKRGGGGYSEHAFGAIDINPNQNEFRGRTTDMPDNAEKLAWLHGYSWGGRFGDPMHYEPMTKSTWKSKLDELVKEGYISEDESKGRFEGKITGPYRSTSPKEDQVKNNELSKEKYEKMFGGTPLSDKYDKIVEEAKKQRISPTLLASVMAEETGRGTSSVLRTKNNPAGIFDSKSNTSKTFDSLDDGIETSAKTVAKNWKAGGENVPGMGRIYAPPGASNDPNHTNSGWPSGVNSFMGQLQGNNQQKPDVVLQDVAPQLPHWEATGAIPIQKHDGSVTTKSNPESLQQTPPKANSFKDQLIKHKFGQNQILNPKHDPEKERPRPGSNGYGSKKIDPDGVGIWT